MDTETRFELIKGVGEEVVKEEELKELVETKDIITAYDGFEPSGLAHLPVGVFRPLLLKDLIKANVKFKLLLADSFALINNKFEGDINKIRKAGEYFLEVWKAAGVDMNKVEVVWHKEFFENPEYWMRVIKIAKAHTLKRTLRSLTIAGRIESENNPTALIFYPSMQCADIFELDVDICQLGMDQRKVNMLAREIAEKMGWKKPVVVSHHMVLGLKQNNLRDMKNLDKDQVMVLTKMSKSDPESCIFVHDSKEDIERKIMNAFCPAKVIENNPIVDYVKHIIFRAFEVFEIKRPEKFGGDVIYESYADFEKDYVSGKIHPLDLKKAVAEKLDELIKPIREYFEKNEKARKLYEEVKSFKITR